MRYKHIIWDWNGTLFEDVFLCCDIMKHILHNKNLPEITLDEYRDKFTFPVIDYYRNVGLNLDKYPFEQLSIEFINEYESRKLNFNLYAGAVETLAELQSMDITQSILSAYSQNTLEEIVEHFNIRKYFVNLVGLNNIYAASKMENGKQWINRLGMKGSEVLLIGDSLHDKEVADEINIDCVLLTHGHQSINTLKKSNAKLLNSFNELLVYIRNNFND